MPTDSLVDMRGDVKDRDNRDVRPRGFCAEPVEGLCDCERGLSTVAGEVASRSRDPKALPSVGGANRPYNLGSLLRFPAWARPLSAGSAKMPCEGVDGAKESEPLCDAGLLKNDDCDGLRAGLCAPDSGVA